MIKEFIKHQKEKKINKLKKEQQELLKQNIIPDNFFRFIYKYQNADWFDLKAFTHYIKKCSSVHIYNFAKLVNNADINELQNAIYENSTLYRSYTKMGGVLNTKHRYYGVPSWINSGFDFAKNIDGANKKLALDKFEESIYKVSNNIFDDLNDQFPSNIKVFRHYLYNNWFDAIIKYSKLQGFNAQKIQDYMINGNKFPKELIAQYACQIKDSNAKQIYDYLIKHRKKELAELVKKSRKKDFIEIPQK